MFNWFNNLKIRNKLLWAFLVIINLSIIIIVIALLGLNYTQTTITDFFTVDGKIAQLGRQSENAMLMAQRSEKNYLLNYQQIGFENARTTHVNQVQSYIATIHQQMAAIRQLETESAHLAKSQMVDRATAEYQTTFLAVIDLLEKRGFKNSGLEGRFRTSVHAIEETVEKHHLDKLTIDMLTMRRHEKDYLLRADQKYVTALYETVSQFKRKVAATELSSSDKERLTELVNQYQARFDELTQIDVQIVASMEKYHAAVERMAPLLEDISATAQLHEARIQAHIQRVTKTVKWLVISASLVVVGIGVLLAIFLASRISKPLTLIVQGAKLLTAGNTTLAGIDKTEITKIITRQDEMGDIGRAFDALASYFNEVIADLVQVSQGLAEGNLNVTPMAEYRGDFVQIKQALETALSNQLRVIEDIVHVSQGLAEGNLSIKPQSEYRGDFAHIKNAQETALFNQQKVIEDIVQVSQGLVKGQLHITSQAQYRGDFVQIKEALEIALSNLRLVIEDIVQVSQGLAEGRSEVTTQAEYRGDFIYIKNALETAAAQLAEVTGKNVEQNWLKTGQAQLNDQMRGDQEIIKQAKNIISFLTTYVEAQVGLFYQLQESTHGDKRPYLEVIASYAYSANSNIPDKFLLGEGLVGQAAMEQQTILRTHTPEESTHIIQSGLAKAIPRWVLIAPFLYESTVKGVIELGYSEKITDIQREFLEQTLPNIGIAMNTADSRTKMQQLLAQSQRQTEELQTQSEELQSQQEELQSINEELQTGREELQNKQEQLQQQNEELQSQSEELQTQQEELRQTNESLEERTKELERQKADIQQKNTALEKTQAQMQKTQVDMEKTQAALVIKAHELELASQYKSEFLANMSHELRTPLNSLLILAELLKDNKKGNLSDKQVEYAQTIHSAGNDLLKLINEILDLSKVEAGKMEIQAEDMSLTELVETIEQKFRPVAVDKNLAFHIRLADDLPQVLHTDAQRLKQIINNLLSNAFKFTEQGEVTLKIEQPINSPIPQKVIAFCVTDTGIGIPKDKQQLIFEAFQQVDGTTSRRFGGTGLGLSISRQLAQLLGGELQLDSTEGNGTTFTLYLPKTFQDSSKQTSSTPLVRPDEPMPMTLSQPVPTGLASTQPEPTVEKLPEKTPIADDRNHLKPADKSLLIIEDDRKFSSLLMEQAHEKNFKCLMAEDGKTGLQLAIEYQPNAIILDVGLPELDGWTVMDRLKDNPDTRHIPVHFMSASDQSQNAKKMGAIGYLLKPVSLEELGKAFNSIEQFLTKTAKNLLVVVNNEPHQHKILELLESQELQTTVAVTIAEALQQLKKMLFDCIILDMDIEQRTGIKLLEQMRQVEGFCQTPMIVYAERDLTTAEETLLLQCADYLTVKTASSPERLLDEATLFLHQISAHLPAAQQKMLRMVHDKEAILTGQKILIVDDDIRNTFALTTFLEDKNMEVIVGNNGKEALELLDEHPNIAIVLMDIMMPEMDGYEAMRQIRAQRPFRKLPIIALTAKAMKGDKSKCIEAGANDYLSKPVDTDKLISLMRVWLYR